MTLDEVNNFLTSRELSSNLLPFKIVFILVSICFVVLIAYYVIKQVYLLMEKRRMFNDFLKPTFDPKTYNLSRWRQIVAALQKDDEINYKLAIINLEGMLYDILRRMSYEGKDLSEMLPEIRDKKLFGSGEAIDALIYLSNKVKGDTAYKVDKEIVNQIAKTVSDFLIKLGII
jgi:hypothetical protein